MSELDVLGKDALDDAPDWEDGGKVHNWRRYVGERTRAIWATLTPEQRAAIALDADDQAGLEEWD